MTTTTNHWHETLRDGSKVEIRPINKNDADRERAFIEELSPQSRRFRFGFGINHPSDALIKQLTNIDQEKNVAFIALANNGTKEVGVCRYCTDTDGQSAECAVVVSDAWQNRGLGKILLEHLLAVAQAHGIKRLYSIDSADNSKIKDLVKHLGFSSTHNPQDAAEMIHTKEL